MECTCKVHGALRRSPDCSDEAALEERSYALLPHNAPLQKAGTLP